MVVAENIVRTSRKSHTLLLLTSDSVGTVVSTKHPYTNPAVISSAFQNHVLAIPTPTTSSHDLGLTSYKSLINALWNSSSHVLFFVVKSLGNLLEEAVTIEAKRRGEGVVNSGLAVNP